MPPSEMLLNPRLKICTGLLVGSTCVYHERKFSLIHDNVTSAAGFNIFTMAETMCGLLSDSIPVQMHTKCH